MLFGLCIVGLEAGQEPRQDPRISVADDQTVSRFISAIYPEIGAPTLRRQRVFDDSIYPQAWSVSTSDAASGVEDEVLRVSAEFIRDRPLSVRASGRWVHSASLDELDARWKVQPVPPSGSQVDRELTRLDLALEDRSAVVMTVRAPLAARELLLT